METMIFQERERLNMICLRYKVISGEPTEIPYRKDVDGLRRQIFHKEYVDKPMLILSILYLILAFFETPRWNSTVPYPDILNFRAISAIEGVIVMLLCIEVIIEISFRTESPRTFETFKNWLRADKWTLAKIVTLIFIVIDYFLWVFSPIPIRVSPFIRPIFVLCRKSWMKSVTYAAAHTVIESSAVLVLLVIHLFWFACIGFWLFHADETYEKHIKAPDVTGQDYCDVFYPNGCTDYFHQVPEALYTMFITLTTVNFPDVMLPYYEVGGWHAFFAAMFFVIFYVIGLYFLMNLLLATIYNDFRDCTKNNMIEKTRRRKIWIKTFWRVCEDKFQCKGVGLSLKHWKHVCSVVRPKWHKWVVELTFRAVVSRNDEVEKDDEKKEEEKEKEYKKEEKKMHLTDLMHSWQYLQLRARGGGEDRRGRTEDGTLYEYIPETPILQQQQQQQQNEHDEKEEEKTPSLLVKRESFEVRSRKSSHSSFTLTVQHYCRAIVSSTVFDSISDIFVLLNALVVALMISENPDTSKIQTNVLIVFAVLFLGYFLWEMIVRLIAAGGLKEFWVENADRPLVRIDAIAVIISFIAMILQFTMSPSRLNCGTVTNPCLPDYADPTSILVGKLLGTLQVIRTFRLLRFFKREFGVALRIVRSLSVYVLWFFCAIFPFVILGNVIFADSLSMNNKDVQESVYGIHDYYNLNFETFTSSFVVLWYQLIVNNWPIVAAGCAASTGRGSRLFFVFFHIYAVLIVLNIMISIIIEVYAMVYDHAGRTMKNWRRVLRHTMLKMDEDRGEILRSQFEFSMPSTTGRLVRNIFFSEVPKDLRPLLYLDRMDQ